MKTPRRIPPKIDYVAKINCTPVMPFVIDAYVSLRQAGNIEACECPASGDEEAFYVRNRRGSIVAVLSFFKSGSSTMTVNMGFVLKRYRSRGYYGSLWDRLAAEGRERGLKSILGYHKPGNVAILGFNQRAGRTIKYVCSEFTL
jgi:predicted GNAT family acetyltransferase